jgi:ATP-dependent protease ClpP protease subunit
MFDVDQTLTDQAVFSMFGEINNQISGEFARFVWAHNLAAHASVDHITLLINSFGGDIVEAFAIIDVMKRSQIPIRTVGLGQVCSSALMIFMCGQQPYRQLSANTAVMSHHWSSEWSGKAHDFASVRRDFDLTTQRMLQHYQHCSGLDQATIERELLAHCDVWLAPSQAVDLGLADQVV